MKKVLWILIASLVVFGSVSYYLYYRATCQTNLAGDCLPKGQCVGPTDAIVDCKPTKQQQ